MNPPTLGKTQGSRLAPKERAKLDERMGLAPAARPPAFTPEKWKWNAAPMHVDGIVVHGREQIFGAPKPRKAEADATIRSSRHRFRR